MSNQPQEQGLVLGDRMNWPYILASAVMKFMDAIVKMEGEQSEQEVREAALSIYNLIPKAWLKADQEFQKEKEEAVIIRKVDARIEYCGIKIGEPKWETEEIIEPWKLLNACVNVFQRRGYLSKTIFTEKIIPEPEDFEEEENANLNKDG